MGRRNSRGLELSFKPLKGGRGRGRWYKKIRGQAVYFGGGNGVSDREGYHSALSAYRLWQDAKKSDQARATATAVTRRLQQDFSALDVDADRLNLEAARNRIATLVEANGAAAPLFNRLADNEEKRRLIVQLEDRSLEDVRRAFAEKKPPVPGAKTTGELLDDFLAVQRERMERRQKLDQLRATGREVKEAAKQNISEGRFAAIARDVAAMKTAVGSEPWDKTEATAANVIRAFRVTTDEPVLKGEHSPHTFNDRIKVARMFCAWAEATYQLDRLPRDRRLFAKYTTSQSTAKAIPLDVLRQLWAGSDDRGRCWLLLGLNCGYYAQDISDLTVEIVDGQRLRHTRRKTGVKVRYKLWKKTREYLQKVLPESGRAFSTENGMPLLHYAKLKKSGNPVRVDNVRNWFFRLCKKLSIKGFSFSNLRDTASTEVEKIDKLLTDPFLAHRDPRMAALYIDGEMVDTGPLDRVIDLLEKRLTIWKPRSGKPAKET